MKRVLVLCFTNLKNDARVTRQIAFLKDNFKVTTVCYDAFPDSSIEILKLEKTQLTSFRKVLLSFFLIFRIYKVAYKLLYDYEKQLKALRLQHYDLIVANDIETLPVAFGLAGGECKVILDAHEYAPRQFEDRLYWRVFFQKFILSICKEYIPKVDGITTINDGLADAYRSNFAVNPVIITNAADYFDLKPKVTHQYPIRLVHHGIFTLSRSPNLMIELMDLLDERFTLDLYFLLPENSSPKTRETFELFKERASKTGRINVLAPMKSSEIVVTINEKYDLGLILVPPVNFNYENGLPNKLFDCIQARLGMVVGPLKEIARIVNDYNIGVVSADFTPKGMADAILSVSPTAVGEFKSNADNAARRMNSKINKGIFLSMINGILGGGE